MSVKMIASGLAVMLLLGLPCLAQEEEAPAGPFTEVETAVCASVEERQPVGESGSFSADIGQIFFWTRCVGATDSTSVTHVWVHEGEERASVELPVKSSNFRTWSSKKILPSWTGNWEVRILDSEGNILKSVQFTITPAEAKPEVESESEPEQPETEGDST